MDNRKPLRNQVLLATKPARRLFEDPVCCECGDDQFDQLAGAIETCKHAMELALVSISVNRPMSQMSAAGATASECDRRFSLDTKKTKDAPVTKAKHS